ncbi:putative Ras family domain containing protein [Neospora caninum Liverpool]|uniref:Putative Ras family domain containing protein n=1 Tax=Neospora caninum (strain Liverpool) TaxID=572307 RepID=F0VRP4_NEOCL|nr:putative Ras family domain containing protein [Neospora caninum Liverpool]CBZ56392.1 putative Ras family domain containing protein [Neospora caninum Liverpool]|eukprot:XP_003886417.1 putative Ras family domain containing protein [Neospora caninum Liverpool]
MATGTDFPLLRITLFGGGSSGKTSLINSFVNNYCIPNSTFPTEWPTLFYKVCRIPEEEGGGGGDSSFRSVCLELEDTYDVGRTDEGRDIRKHMTMKRRIMTVGKGMTDFTPFNLWKVPKTPSSARERFSPITNGRMGMIIVFDVNRKATLHKAMEIYDLIESVREYKRTVQRVLGEAEVYAQTKFIRFWKVSATSGKNVNKMFQEMVYRILGCVMLWDIEYEEDSESEEEESSCALM